MRVASLPLLVLSVAFSGLTACDDDPTNPPQQTATLRVINAATGTSNVVVLHDGTILPAPPVSFRAASACAEIPAGSRTLTFRAGADTLTTASFNFEAGELYTAVIADDLPGTGHIAAVFSDDVTPAAGNNALRLINATATAGDVHVRAPGGPFQTPAFGNLSPFGLYTDPGSGHSFVHRPTTETDVLLYDVGQTTNLRGSLSLTNTMPASRVATVVFFDPGTPAGATALLAARCD